MPKRPRSVTFLIIGVFLLGIWNLLRALALWQQSGLLRSEGVTLDPNWRILAAVSWALLFSVLSFALWRRRRAARPWLLFILAAYYAHNLLLLVAFALAPVLQQALLARIVLYLSAVIFAAWALYRPGNRSFWRTDSPEQL